MIGGRFTSNGRALTVTGSYDGHGPDDPPGWYYVFDDKPAVTHWIPARAVPMRFKSLIPNGPDMGQKPAIMA